ncbi:MAG TPA: AraC family transcriptional regulator [Acidimicrobiales bacterium]|nr:AraC family transcriptional regulator [Acidimicrobiales bacterium]
MLTTWLDRAPHPELAGVVNGYAGYRVEHDHAGVHRGLPIPYLTMLISLAEPICSIAADGTLNDGVNAVVGGLHDQAVLVERPVLEYGIAIDLSATSAERVLGVSGYELHGRAVALPDLLGRPGARMVERVRDATTWSERFGAVDAELRRLLRSPRRHDVLVDAASRALIEGRQVSAVAEDLGWSRQHLTRRTRAATGATPRQLSRLGRFQRSARLLRAEGPGGSLAVVAHQAGYADQSHLIREWRSFAGCTPGAWRVEEGSTSS